ncbi:MAG: hypothetical protein KJ587_07030 [Alphaproteobacteria bacterium]|nr:hypothetical protein [Alphaproteobacteria bacterium]
MLRWPNRLSRFNAPAILTALVLCGWQAPPASAQMVDLTDAQRTLLAQQLKEHYKCDLGAVLFSREIEVGGRKQLEGRIRCDDQREVDFTQAGANQKFQLKLCMPTVC